MAKQFHFTANTINELTSKSWVPTQLVYNGKCKAGYTTTFTYPIYKAEGEELISRLAYHLMEYVARHGKLTVPIMVMYTSTETEIPYLFPLVSIYSKNKIANLDKSIAELIVKLYREEDSFALLFARTITNWNDIVYNVDKNTPTLSEHFELNSKK